jgi:hypothetical protein
MMPDRKRWSRENPGTGGVSAALLWQRGGGGVENVMDFPEKVSDFPEKVSDFPENVSEFPISLSHIHMTYLARSHVLRSWPGIHGYNIFAKE